MAAMAPAEQAAAEAVIEEVEAEGRRTLALMPGRGRSLAGSAGASMFVLVTYR